MEEKIDEAIDKINDINPDVSFIQILEKNEKLNFALHKHKLSKLICEGNMELVLKEAQTKLAPIAEKHVLLDR